MEVSKHFPSAMGVDDFIARLEMALAAYGFTGDNAIGERSHTERWMGQAANLQSALGAWGRPGMGPSKCWLCLKLFQLLGTPIPAQSPGLIPRRHYRTPCGT